MDFKWKNALKVLEKRKQQMRRIILLSGYKTRARHQTMLSPMQICKERNIVSARSAWTASEVAYIDGERGRHDAVPRLNSRYVPPISRV